MLLRHKSIYFLDKVFRFFGHHIQINIILLQFRVYRLLLIVNSTRGIRINFHTNPLGLYLYSIPVACIGFLYECLVKKLHR